MNYFVSIVSWVEEVNGKNVRYVGLMRELQFYNTTTSQENKSSYLL